MKNFEDDFFDLLEEIDIESAPLTDDEIQRIYSMEIQKISNKNTSNHPKLKKKGIKILLIASIITIGAITAGANYNKISDIFNGIFKEQNDKGESVKIEKNIPIIEKAGCIINESVSANGLDVSVKGVVGDNDTIYLMIDVIDPSGKPLKSSKNESENIGQLKFNSAYLHIDNAQEGHFNTTGQYCWTSVIKTNNNRATFLINEKTEYENIIGKKTTLILKDLMEYSYPNAKEIDMTYNNLYDIYIQFKETPVFITEPTQEELDFLIAIDESGEIEPILKSGDEKISFSNKFKDLYITNIAFKDNTLYMNFFLDSNEDIDKYSSLALKNIKTGEIVEFYTGSGSTNFDNGVAINSEIRKTCKDITSAEQLKDYIIVTDADYRFEPVVEGEWKFEFNLDYENTTQSYKVNQQLDLSNSSFYCEEIKISPISMNMKLKTDVQKMPLIDNIKLIMNDGNITDNIMNIQYMYEYSDETKTGILKCILPYIVNVPDIKSIQIEDCIINLN